MWIVPVAPGDEFDSVAVNFEPSTGTPVVAVDGALTEIDGDHLLACTFVVVMAGLQRELRALFEESPLKCAHHQ